MTSPQNDPCHGWIWDMFQEYVRKITRTASTGAMPLEEMQSRYQRMHRDFEIKLMVSDKVGMIIQFLDLDMYGYPDFESLLVPAAFLNFLSQKYGGGKYKVNLYHDGTFIATKNFKIEEGPEKWRELLKQREGQNP
jgi:hypothetical protein